MTTIQTQYVVSSMQSAPPTAAAPREPRASGPLSFRALVERHTPPEPVEATAQSRVEAHVEGLLQDETELDQLIARSVDGDHMSPRELLELQALVYGYTQRVEVATRVVDRSVGALKQLLQMQV